MKIGVLRQMTRCCGAAIAAALIAGVTLAASVADAAEGWYVSGQPGGSFLSDAALDDPTGILVALGTEVEFEPGFSVAGSVGYGFDIGVRVETEVNYAKNDIDQFEILGLSLDADGDVSVIGFMAKAFYDLDTGGPWKPYAGGGVGAATISVNDAAILGIAFADDGDTVFAWQVGGGVGYEVAPVWILSLDYRFFATADPDFNAVGGGPFSSEYESHWVSVGMRYTF
jgi:opacity protein-like surface antigen